MTTVLLADDHALVRAGLSALLGGTEHIQVVGEAADGQQAVELATRLRPDVVLMDLSMPVLDGIAATRRIVGGVPGTVVVVLTSFSDRRRAGEALGAGAVSYLVKDCDPHDIITAVRCASRGGSTVDPRVARALPTRPCRVPAEAAPGHRPQGSWAGLRALRRHRD